MAQDCRKMAPDGFKMASRWPQMASTWPQNGPKIASKWPQDRNQDSRSSATKRFNVIPYDVSRHLEETRNPKNNIRKTRKRQSLLLRGRRSLLRPSRRLTCVDTQGPLKITSQYVRSPIVEVKGSTERRLFPGCAKESGPVTGHRTLSATLCH